ncbi:DUF2971 domain-containing protein [Zoogloea sp.]|uniref:DUF2971 domain-containing protein n=1 Tax=Zoogloea sp. TaxID=49181 RepID=UPI0014160B71|nr:MAG: DUF2971 domain-containing protein [Zoogloea sp.]
MDLIYDDFLIEKVLNVTELPTHLYHYTSVSTLALILESKALRFRRLDYVNDPTEATTNVENTNQLVFASCWTANKGDSIAMWKMYAPGGLGVRVKLPTNLFHGRCRPRMYEKGGAYIETTKFGAIERKSTKVCVNFIYGPNKIYCTDDEKIIKSESFQEYPEQRTFHLMDAGNFKHTCWAFEDEWRYKVLATPIAVAETLDSSLIKTLTDTVENPVLSQYVDVPLDESALSEIEILLSPNRDPALLILVESVLSRYGIEKRIEESRIKIRW